uniref:Glycosyl transferase CAP10 domain-containing protein n=1 Tax=Haptolina ericina TaxID=156174 RepID=A0A7S3FIJ1_9EUKA
MAARDALLVRDVNAGKWFRWSQFDTANRSGTLPPKQPPLAPSVACHHKFALSLPGFGYSSRLRTLLACGALVVHVRHDDNEFFMPALEDGTHLVMIHGRDAVRTQLLPTLERLRRDPARAARIAAAGRRFAEHWLSHDSVLDYVSSMLSAYSARYRGTVTAPKGYMRLSTRGVEEAGDTLQRATGMCRCLGRRPEDSNITPDEWRAMRRAGATCMSQGAGQRCRPWAPRGGGYCFAPKCCDGWDCGTRALNYEAPTSYV